MPWKCFLAAPTGLARQSLRRYSSTPRMDNCATSGFGYHNASADIGDIPWTDELRNAPPPWPADDPRWPTTCVCGYQFTDQDERQYNVEQTYTRPEGGPSFTLGRAPIGALWYLPWLTDRWDPPTPEQLADPTFKSYLSVFYWRDHYGKRPPLALQCPGRSASWVIDSFANNGPGWQVTGEVPLLTAHPSINIVGHYHGWLQHGVLTDDCEGRTFNEGDIA